mmetsp:Transcript_1155/g.2143  ORF Transcript_1155/g.2143 Transcript_1155/m.2143 type:complete len:133 (+) Transcript_1155:792-1190(+)
MLGYKPFVFSFGGHAFIQLLPKLRGSHHCSKPNVHVRLPCCWAQQTTPQPTPPAEIGQAQNQPARLGPVPLPKKAAGSHPAAYKQTTKGQKWLHTTPAGSGGTQAHTHCRANDMHCTRMHHRQSWRPSPSIK